MNTDEQNRIALANYRKIENKYGLAVYGSRNHKNFKMVFARGRKADPENLTPEENHFGYPPPDYCHTLGRANYPYHPVMYAGDSPEVIGNELGLKTDEWWHLAIYYTPNATRFEYLLLLHDAVSKDNIWRKILLEYKQFMAENHPVSHPEGPDKTWDRIQSAALAFRNDNYEDTAAIAHHWIYVRNIDAILYPSVRSDRYCNFALNPKFVDKKLALYCVHSCRWKGETFEMHQTGRLVSGILSWKPTNKNDYDELQEVYSHLHT